jgi:benzylsuccinate CoA-transferase BbsE subunit
MAMNKETVDLPLSPYRALDLTDEKGYFCGQILTLLGADVIKVEPPGGDPGRNIGPFYHDIPDKNKSLYFFAYNTNKRSITLNIETRDGRKIFRRLLKTADFVIESFAPGYMDKMGLSYQNLSKINPRLIMVSITPFGQNGPYKDWKGPDIVAIGMGGLSYMTGSPDRPPVRVSVDQAYTIAGSQAAMGAMIAHYYREASGRGQQVDTSIQESVAISPFMAPITWYLEKSIVRRVGPFRPKTGRHLWPCKDGYVAWRIYGGRLGAKTRAVAEWADSEGEAGELTKVNWEKVDYLGAAPEKFERWQSLFGEFFLTHTKAELCREALAKGIVLFPASTPKDLLEDPQLKARGYWTRVEHPELGSTVIYPGPLYKSSEITWEIRRAPLIGEHNAEVYEKEMGFSKEELVILKHGGVI